MLTQTKKWIKRTVTVTFRILFVRKSNDMNVSNYVYAFQNSTYKLTI